MKNRRYIGFYIGWVLLVTALALVARKMNFFDPGDAGSRWAAFFLLIPVGGFAIRAVRRWREGDRRSSRNLTRIALMILPVFAAFLYPPLWKVIYIPFMAVLGVEMILKSILFSRPPKHSQTGGEDSSSESSETK